VERLFKGEAYRLTGYGIVLTVASGHVKVFSQIKQGKKI
jgi:hypothetical protein